MEKHKKNQVKKAISWVLILAVVALLAALPMIAANEETVSGPQASVLSAKAEIRDISSVVVGGGTLTGEASVAITIPAEVKLTEYLVSNGDLVVEGQPVATADRVSVMTAITKVQETMEQIREELNDVSNDTESKNITATAGGTVKVIYASVGESVQDVMLRDGALAVLSLDGMMAVQIRRNTDLTGGDRVCVTFSDDREVEGRVESNLAGVLTVTVDDEGFSPGEKVKVTTEDGDRIGSGELYIHSPWNVVAYSGTVTRIRVKVEEQVNSGRTLFNLENSGHTTEFDALSRKHRKYEELMLNLFKMYQSETVNAPADGMITGVDETGTYMLAAQETGWVISFLSNSPNGDDETTYINYVGQVAEVGIDGLIMKMNPQELAIADYKDLSGVPLDPVLMNQDAIYAAEAPIYELSDGEWVQISAEAITVGDILLFAGDSAGNFVWVVRIGSGAVQPDVPTDPSQPTEPGNPEGTDPTEPSTPTDPSRPGGGFPQGGSGGGMPSFGGGAMTEDADDLYSLDMVTIASVTPQETVTIQITVDELDISKLYVGQSAAVTVNALTGQQFMGTVTDIAASGENEGGNSKFTVDITVAKTAEMLQGMQAAVSVEIHKTEKVVSLPVAALIENGTKIQVYTGYLEESEEFTGEVTVVTGASDGEFVQILSGIGEGQTVYYPYYDTLVISNAPEMGGGFPFG